MVASSGRPEHVVAGGAKLVSLVRGRNRAVMEGNHVRDVRLEIQIVFILRGYLVHREMLVIL